VYSRINISIIPKHACRESRSLCNGETSTNGIECTRYLYAIQCLVYRWVGKSDSVIVIISGIMESACISVHVTVLFEYDYLLRLFDMKSMLYEIMIQMKRLF